MEKIVVVFDSERAAQRICAMIESAGTAECVLCRSGGEARRAVAKLEAAMVICGFRLPDGSGEELYEDLPDHITMLMIATQPQLDLMPEEIIRLPAPISRSNLLQSVELLLEISREKLRQAKPKRSGDERELIDNAKALLMERNGMTEEQAHRFLQKTSMSNGMKLPEAARMVLDSGLK